MKGRISMLFAEVSGSAWEIGFQIGEWFRDAILQNCLTFCPPVGTVGLSQMISHYEDRLSMAYPALLEEIEGIAKGAGAPYEQVFYLSFPLNWQNFVNGCTQLVFCGSDVGPLLGKSNDVGLCPKDAFISIKRTDSLGTYHIGTIGAVGSYAGMNSAGLCIGYSAGGWYERNPNGFWFALLIRLVLEKCRNTAEAIMLLENYPLDISGANFAMVDGNGCGAVVEKSPYMQRVRWAENGVVSATNHVEHPDMRRDLPQVAESDLYREIMGRRLYLNSITETNNEFTLSNMMRIFQSHGDSGIGSICSHNYADSGDTVWSAIFAPKEPAVYIADLHPCETGFVRWLIREQ